MKWLTARAIGGLLLVFAPAWAPDGARAQGAPVESRIEEVTVFPSGAMVERRARVKLQRGYQQVLFANLPAALEEDSVQAGGRGEVGVKLLGVRVGRTFLPEAPPGRVRELEGKIRELEGKLKEVDDALQVARTQEDFVRSLLQSEAARARRELAGEVQPLGPDRWKAALDFVGNQLTALAEKTRALTARRLPLAEQLSALRRELQTLQRRSARETRSAQVELEAEGEGDFELALRYRVRRATWAPRYDVRLPGDSDQVEITYYGIVRQQTGEDWREVKLKLSTAQPALPGRMPELYAWNLDFPPPRVARPVLPFPGAMPAPEPPKAALEMEARGAEAFRRAARPPREAETFRAEVIETPTAVSYAVAGRKSVPPNGEPQRAPIAVVALTAQRRYATTPKLDPRAFLQAAVANTSPYTFLAGRANLFLAGEFTGTTDLKLIAPQEKFDLFLGADDRVKVERKLLEKKEEERGLLTTQRRVNYRYRITVENYKQSPQRVDVWDHLPVPRHKEIAVEKTRVEPAPAEEKEGGILRWELQLRPGEKKTIEYVFSVSHPADRPVVGLTE